MALGVLQSAISLLIFIGLKTIGASRSQPLRNSFPLRQINQGGLP
jgi:hypothetical protein